MKRVERKSVRGGEDANGRNGREEAEGEVIERVERDPELTKHEQRLLGRYATPSILEPLISFVCIPFEPTRGNIRWHLRASAHPSTPNRLYPIDRFSLLLHTQSFRCGILKEHGIAGTLLC